MEKKKKEKKATLNNIRDQHCVRHTTASTKTNRNEDRFGEKENQSSILTTRRSRVPVEVVKKKGEGKKLHHQPR